MQQKGERKRLKRLRIGRIGYGREAAYNHITTFQRSFDKHVLHNFRNKIYDFLLSTGFVDETAVPLSKIEIPEVFSFSKKYEESLEDKIASYFIMNNQK